MPAHGGVGAEGGDGGGGRRFPRLAVIGCGGVAGERHLPALARLGWRPRVLVDQRTDRAVELARRYGAPRVAADAADLAPGEVEAALVATHMASHAQVSLALLRRGIHVFVEKPMATAREDAESMVETAAAKSVRLAVGHMRRFLFVNRWVKALVDSGALGEVERFDVREGESFHTRRLTAARAVEGTGPYSPAFWDPKASGGGVLLDTGSHTLDTLLWWLGDGRPVRYRDDSLGGVEGDALLELELHGGATGTVELSRTRALRNTAVITGSRGQVEVALQRNAVVRARPEDLMGFELDGRTGGAMPDERLHDHMFERELEDWLRALRSGGEPFVSGASAARAVRIIDGCYRVRQPLPRSWSVPARRATGGTLEGKDVLVTGASGFIGARLVERLVLEEGANVRAAVRTFQNAARIARFPARAVALRRFDMADRDAGGDVIDALVDGCHAVFHLARDTRSPAANREAARSIGAACLRNGVRRLVHVSSLSVYEPLPDAPLTEASPLGRRFGDDKLAAQHEVARMVREEGLRAAILQPTVVYGPFSRYWTERPADMLTDGTVFLPAPGDGICNAVHVDDVVQALLLAAQRDEAVGESFLISGPEHPTWLDFYGAYARALGRDGAVRTMAYDEMERRSRSANGLRILPTPRRVLGHGLLRPLRQVLRFAVYRRLGERGKSMARRFYEQGRLLPARNTGGPPEFLPSRRLLDLYAAKCSVRIDKARRLLGYEPDFGLERGMELTARYLEWARGRDGRAPAARGRGGEAAGGQKR